MDDISKFQIYIPHVVRSNDKDTPIPISEDGTHEIVKWTFLSRKRLKKQIKNFGRYWQHSVSIYRIVFEHGKPVHFIPKTFEIWDKKDLEKFTIELANLADLYGIVKLRQGEIWVKHATDQKELNIDADIIERIMDRLIGRIEVKIVNVDGTFTLDHVFPNP